MKPFKLQTSYEPKGSQPKAIEELAGGINKGYQKQTLLGVTGSGKSLGYSELILLKDKTGKIKKKKIGDFVENQFKNPQKIGESEFENISGYSIISFNSDNYEIEEKQIKQVSRHKEEDIYEIVLDDFSCIRITKYHTCFRLNNCKLELCKTTNLKIGDYLPTSNFIPSPSLEINWVNLLDYNPNVKVYIRNLIQKLDSDQIKILDVLKDEYRAPNWKINQILNKTKERGITSPQLYKYLSILHVDLKDVNDYVKIITKKRDVTSPLVKIDDKFLFLLGVYISEGVTTKNYVLISNSNEYIQNICIDFFQSLGIKSYRRNKNDIVYYSVLLSNFLKTFGSISYKKKIPNFVYNLCNRQLSFIIKGIFDGDGWVEKNSVLLLSASKELINDVKNLLLRFKITSQVSTKKLNRTYYKISISGKQNLLLFQKFISFTIPHKKEKLLTTIKKNSNTNVDLLPNSSEFIKKIRKKHNLYQKDIAHIIECERSYISMVENRKRHLSKGKFLKLAKWLNKNDSNEYNLSNLLDFNFRKIVKITKIKNKREYVYDLSVEDNENFMAGQGNIFVHNTFTMAHIIEKVQRPTIVIAHNKTLAGQLYNEFKTLFPENRVEYFVSYYDYYQPESYIPERDLYIEKDADINPKIEQMRLSATASLLSRRDVIVVASVSAIYSVGDPADYQQLGFEFEKRMHISRSNILDKLIAMQYERNDFELQQGRFRVKGDVIDIVPAYYDNIIRFELFGDEIDRITEIDKITGDVVEQFDYYYLYPAKHFVIPEEKQKSAIGSIKEELKERLPELEMIEQHRLKQRTLYDIEMIEETGFCKGIENYSRHFDKRKAGEKPHCLLDYFPKDFLLFIDESHRTIPQIHGMHRGDYSRKKSLIEYGFRLPSAFDNRPLTFNEFSGYMNNTIFVSATPGDYELDISDQIVEQLIRPTGLVDPEVEVRPIEGQIPDLIKEIHDTIAKGHRILVTTLTKRLAEELSNYLAEKGIKTRYLHAEINTIERGEILRQLRLGEFDVLVGINLLREGIDIPEIGFIGVLDADKEGFLRDYRSLIQIIGRAARNVDAKVVLYADKITDSMQKALDETMRRRNKQIAFNLKHGITPQTIQKPIPEKTVEIKDTKHIPKSDIPKIIVDLEKEMKKSADDLDFEKAIFIRDKIQQLKNQLEKTTDS